jgi:hypothetical protein
MRCGNIVVRVDLRLRLRFVRVAALLIVASAAPAVLVPTAASHVHRDRDGTTISWYPHECCHNGDCRPVASVRRASEGLWMTTVDGLTMLVGPSDVRRPSRDMRWHICIAPDDTDTQRIRCIFEPANS